MFDMFNSGPFVRERLEELVCADGYVIIVSHVNSLHVCYNPIIEPLTWEVKYIIPIRKRVEEIFGWMKTVGGFRRTRYKGLDRTGLAGYLVATAYNLVRMAKLLELAKEAPEAQAA